ncbi:hypothetical protein ACQP1G_35055 [Nocardia sp. CA-107356]|uniref:hypothetical protein n=1 Tax=Nocardia sp. CA-107356 TaxID=3239972 RepID=UPI003D91CD8A
MIASRPDVVRVHRLLIAAPHARTRSAQTSWTRLPTKAFGDVGSVLTSPEEAMARPGVLDRIMEIGSDTAGNPEPGPSRIELLAATVAG